MSDAQGLKDTVKQHFENGLPRLDMPMLPRDPERALGTLRKTLVSSFNYCKGYPRKLALFILVLRWVTIFAMLYQEADTTRREEAKAKMVEDKIEDKENMEEVDNG